MAIATAARTGIAAAGLALSGIWRSHPSSVVVEPAGPDLSVAALGGRLSTSPAPAREDRAVLGAMDPQVSVSSEPQNESPVAGAGGGERLNDGREPPRVSVIVPALNEEESIGWVIEHIPRWVSEIVLVDGLSGDGTELVVSDRRPDVVIVHQRARGKGAALRAGFAAASGEIIVMIDADGSTDPREMDRFVAALMDGADFVKGSRNLAGGGSVDFTRLRHWGNLGFVHAANLLFGVRFSDLCYGYCAFWARDLGRLALTANGFEIEMELVLSAVKAGLEVAEVPSMELERRAGFSNLNAWADGKRVLSTLLRERLRPLDARRGLASSIALERIERPAHNTAHWVPAGNDRRAPLTQDRRQKVMSPEEVARTIGVDRRVGNRRARATKTTQVLVARPATSAGPALGQASSVPASIPPGVEPEQR